MRAEPDFSVYTQCTGLVRYLRGRVVISHAVRLGGVGAERRDSFIDLVALNDIAVMPHGPAASKFAVPPRSDARF